MPIPTLINWRDVHKRCHKEWASQPECKVCPRKSQCYDDDKRRALALYDKHDPSKPFEGISRHITSQLRQFLPEANSGREKERGSTANR